MYKEYLFQDKDSLYKELADECGILLKQAIDNNEKATFVVPGGTSPAPVFNLLSQKNLGWDKVSVIPSDDRWVDASHDSSNQKLIEENLLINDAKRANFVALKNNQESPRLGQDLTEELLQQVEFPLDLVMLGMGTDGHFASLFPGCEQINSALDVDNHNRISAINAEKCQVAGDYTQRISLTLSSFLNSKQIIVLITGQEKLEVIRRAAKDNMPLQTPVSALLNQTQVPVSIYWSK